MKDFPSVDGIIRGEAEGPLAELASTLLQQKEDLFSIPNLTWRRKGKILINPLSYVASEEDLNSLSFANFSLLRNHSKYIQHGKLISRTGKIAGEKPAERESLELPVFHLTVGRGCPVQCTWCSGGILAQRTISGRKEVIFRKIDDVLQTIREAISHGYEVFQICFDPYPQRHEYFLELFSRIRERNFQWNVASRLLGFLRSPSSSRSRRLFQGQNPSSSLSRTWDLSMCGGSTRVTLLPIKP